MKALPFFNRPTEAPEEPAAGATMAQTAPNPEASPAPDLDMALQAAQAAHAELMARNGKVRELKAACADYRTKAAQADTEAENHRERFREVLRSDGEKSELHTITGKQETAKSVAAEYRAYAEELELDIEEAEIGLQRFFVGFFSARDKALKLYAENKLSEALDEIENKLLVAIKLKAIAIKDENDYLNTHRENDLSNTDAVFSIIQKRLSGKLSATKVEAPDNDAINWLLGDLGLSGIPKISPAGVNKRGVALKKRREQSHAAKPQ